MANEEYVQIIANIFQTPEFFDNVLQQFAKLQVRIALEAQLAAKRAEYNQAQVALSESYAPQLNNLQGQIDVINAELAVLQGIVVPS